MSPGRWGWSLFGFSVTASVIGTALLAQVPPADLKPEDGSWLINLTLNLMVLVFALVGAVVAARMPANPIGWLFCAVGVVMALASVTYAYAAYAILVEPRLPGGVAAAWVSSWVYFPALLGGPPLLFLLFPDGRPVSQRWSYVIPLTAVGLLCQIAGVALAPGGLRDSPVSTVQNPLGVDVDGLAAGIEFTGLILGLASVLLATSSLMLRWRRARGDERQQLKWVAWAAGLLASLPLAGALDSVAPNDGLGVDDHLFATVALPVALATLPVAAGVAILRYRLYDIDVIINRTLVYGALTITLGCGYLGSVLLLRLTLSPLTGQSDLAVAGSTLAVAALFRPVRTRIQTLVDRRFYRQRYDAARTLNDFTTRLRHEVDLDAVGADLRTAVRKTVHPAHISLWLRP